MATVFELIAGWLTGGKDPHWLVVAKKRPSAVLRHFKKQPDGIDQRIARGESALMVATMYGRIDVMKALLSEGADPALANDDGNTALHIAAFFGRVEELELLLETGLTTTCLNNNMRTPLDVALTRWDAEQEGLVRNLIGVFSLDLDVEHVKACRVFIGHLLKAQAAGEAPPQDPEPF